MSGPNDTLGRPAPSAPRVRVVSPVLYTPKSNQEASAIKRRQRETAEKLGVTVDVLLAEIVPQLVALSVRQSATRKARSAAKKTLNTIGIDVAATTAQHRAAKPRHTRAETSAANKRVASTIRKIDGHVSGPPRRLRVPKPQKEPNQ